MPKPRRFSFRPVYYDEKKEEQARLMKMLVSSVDENTSLASQRKEVLKEKIKNAWIRKSPSFHRKESSMRILIIAALLIVFVYILLK